MKKLLFLMAMIPALAQADVYMLNGLECKTVKPKTVDAAFQAITETWPGDISVLTWPKTIKNDKNGMNGRMAVLNACLNGKCTLYMFTNSMRQCKSFEEAALRVTVNHLKQRLTTDQTHRDDQ